VQDSSKNNKNVISKRLRALVAQDGLEEVLSELEGDQQAAILDALQLKDKSGTNKQIATRIAGGMCHSILVVSLSSLPILSWWELPKRISNWPLKDQYILYTHNSGMLFTCQKEKK
jgi:hypothetical protein